METLWPHLQKALELYFLKRNERSFRGRCITTLSLTLVRDLDIFYTTSSSFRYHSYYKRLKLNKEEDLEVLRSLDKSRVGWRELRKRIGQASDAMHSFEDNAERQ